MTKPFHIKNRQHPLWPRWFNIDRYQCLQQLTADQLIHELQRRLELLHAPLKPNGQRLTDDRNWKQILQGNVLISERSLLPVEQHTVKQLSHVDLEQLCADLRTEQGEHYFSGDPIFEFPQLGAGSKRVVFSFDLLAERDATILATVAYQLQQARLLSNMPEPPIINTKKSGIDTFLKLLEYRVLPYLDLMLYCHNYPPLSDLDWQPLSFSQPALTELLFNNEKDVEQVKKTYLPFYRRVIEDEADLAKLFASVRKSPELAQQPLHRFFGVKI